MGHGEKILVIGRHPAMLANVVNMLRHQGYHAIGTTTNEEAINVFESDTIDAVVIGGGVDAASRVLFHAAFANSNSKVKIIDAHPLTVLRELEAALLDTNA